MLVLLHTLKKGAPPLQKADNFWSGGAEGLITTSYLTIKIALAAAVLEPLSVCSAPTGSVFLKPLQPLFAVPFTFTVTVQEPLAGIKAPDANFTDEVVAVTPVPPTQEVLGLPLTTTPLGNVSVSDAVRVAGVLLGLLKLMVRVETPFL